jgi:hypothetical protein
MSGSVTTDASYFFVRDIESQRPNSPAGTQRGAPHLFTSFGKADGRRKTLHKPDEYEVVEVQLTEIKKGS